MMRSRAGWLLAAVISGSTEVHAADAQTEAEQGGANVPGKFLAAGIDRRPIFLFDEQVKLMERAGGAASQADEWFKGLGEFLQSVGTVPQAPDTRAFVTDEVLTRIVADPKLKAFVSVPRSPARAFWRGKAAGAGRSAARAHALQPPLLPREPDRLLPREPDRRH